MLNKQGERALVYLALVDDIQEITFLNDKGELENCANIVKLVTGGWNLVVQRNRFEVGELFVYCETDCILPKDVELFSFLEGKRIKTKKLKGVVSQGVAFTIPEILDVINTRFNTIPIAAEDYAKYSELLGPVAEYDEGDDWTELVGAVKYDEYTSEKGGNNAVKMMPGDARGKFPAFIPKTDEERIQNLAKELKYDYAGKLVIEREKLHGSSVTIYAKVDSAHDDLPSRLDFGICSRNFELHLHSAETNNYVKTGLPALHKLLTYCLDSKTSLALQGELVGPGVNGNPYALPELTIRFFTAYDINEKYRYTDKELMHLLADLELEPCPFISFTELSSDMDEVITQADAKSALNPKYDREGKVVRAIDSSFSFKVISNKWLLKEKD